MKAFVAFLVRVLTGTPATVAMLGKLSGPMIAAILAVFYDIIRFLITETGAVEDIAAGKIDTGLSTILSDLTRYLLAAIVRDAKAANTVVVDDLKALGITTGDSKPVAA